MYISACVRAITCDAVTIPLCPRPYISAGQWDCCGGCSWYSYPLCIYIYNIYIVQLVQLLKVQLRLSVCWRLERQVIIIRENVWIKDELRMRLTFLHRLRILRYNETTVDGNLKVII